MAAVKERSAAESIKQLNKLSSGEKLLTGGQPGKRGSTSVSTVSPELSHPK